MIKNSSFLFSSLSGGNVERQAGVLLDFQNPLVGSIGTLGLDTIFPTGPISVQPNMLINNAEKALEGSLLIVGNCLLWQFIGPQEMAVYGCLWFPKDGG